MKKSLSFILVIIFALTALASCAENSAPAANPKITLTSSDAAGAAEWLEARLGGIPDRIVIGTDASSYGVDVSALEADGYLIRDLGGEVALFAKTADGLDRAVRKYAKTVESGAAIGDVTYHEGARIKRLTVAGRDIAEFTIYSENETYMLKAANELSSRLKTATGVAPEVSADEPTAPYISIRYVDDEALGNVGHRWNVTENGVVIECSDKYKAQSASLAVRRFLEKNLGWMGLIFGMEDLPSADRVTIDAGVAFEETTAFDFAGSCSSQAVKYERLQNQTIGYGVNMLSCHGMQGHAYAGELSSSENHNWATDQPCWLDEVFYEVAREDIVAYIESCGGVQAVENGTLQFVDVAHGDNSNWCYCKNCSKMFVSEGRTHAAEVLTWVNRLSEDLNETYPGLYYGVFAYEMTKTPPKTIKPNEHVYITFCYDRSCSSHTLDGTHCTSFDQWDGEDYSNVALTARLTKWLDLTKNIYVWYYGLHNVLLTISFIHNVREDLKFLHEAGVKGIYWEAHESGFSANWIGYCLHSELLWNVDMIDEEYDALYDRLLSTFYGDAAPIMKEYISITDRIHEYGSCYVCWGGLMDGHNTEFVAVDADTFAAKYDTLFELIESATSIADSAIMEERMTLIGCALIYKGSLCAYPAAKEAGDTERMEELCRRYDLIDGRMKRWGMDMTDESTITTLWSAAYERSLKDIFPD